MLRFVCSFIALLLVSGCASDVVYKNNTRPYEVGGNKYYPMATATTGFSESGVASWYGKKFHGRKTASGEKYNQNAMTAAHKTLPFGTRVRVTNLENKKSVSVVVNDRGPFVKGRIIDVSRAAAKKLGMVNSGIARVCIKVEK